MKKVIFTLILVVILLPVLTGCSSTTERRKDFLEDAQDCVNKDGHPFYYYGSSFFTTLITWGCIEEEEIVN